MWSKGQVTGNKNVEIVFAHIFVKSGSSYVKHTPKWSSSVHLFKTTLHQRKIHNFFAIFVCLSVTSITYLSFNQNWNEVKSSYFTYRLLLTLVNGEVIVRLAVKKSELKITACETSVEIVFAYIRENRSIYIKLTQKWSLAHSTNIFNTFTSGNA